MIKISAIIITKNEENMIADCIDSVSFCDEIVVIDSESTDNTVELAERMDAKIFIDKRSFSQAERRNLGKEKARGTWLLYIDADERITPELREHILTAIQNEDADIAAYKIHRKNFYFGNHEWPTTESLERLFRKEKLREWYGDLHETAKVDGEIGILEGFLTHYTHRDLSSMLAKTVAWSDVEARLRFESKHPKMTWWRFPRVMITAFIDSYIRQKGYKVGTVGLMESMFQSYSMFVTYAKLWELQQKNNIHEKK